MLCLDKAGFVPDFKPISRILIRGLIGILLLSFSAAFSWADDLKTSQPKPVDLMELSLEDLLDIEITSVSKKTEKISDAPAAIFVITREDIRRSGVNSIPEVLRMVPGLQVGRIIRG